MKTKLLQSFQSLEIFPLIGQFLEIKIHQKVRERLIILVTPQILNTFDNQNA